MAWAIADKEDADTLEVVWKAIKVRCPNAEVNNLMTDDGMYCKEHNNFKHCTC